MPVTNCYFILKYRVTLHKYVYDIYEVVHHKYIINSRNGGNRLMYISCRIIWRHGNTQSAVLQVPQLEADWLLEIGKEKI